MNVLERLSHDFFHHVSLLFDIPTFPAEHRITFITDEKKQLFGDASTTIALYLAKELKKAPQSVAHEITGAFSHPFVASTQIAGPGFINFFLSDAAIAQLGKELFLQKSAFFKPTSLTARNYLIEFVSANPTGPLHFGHGRGGIIGDVLGNVLRFLGHSVTKEFYINDAGEQVKKLGRSLKIRCLQELGHDCALPEDSYHGDYLVAVAQQCLQEHGKECVEQPDDFFENYGKNTLLQQIKKTLNDYNITFDSWFSEKKLRTEKAVEKALATLDNNGFLYKQDGALWFASTRFGDDKDRVVQKASGEVTYVAPDIAYLKNKVERGYTDLIMTLGHDHHSYAVRLDAVRQALGYSDTPLTIILYQLVKIKASGEFVRMSKRAGNIVTLHDVIALVGTDVARFFYLNRKADAQLEFDIDLALKKSDENPAYYIQYAYVRTGSILNKIHEYPELHAINDTDAQNLGREELLLLKKVAILKELLGTIAHQQQTHILAYYTLELCQLFSSYYSKHRIIDNAAIAQSKGRLVLTQIIRDTLTLCLDLMGLSKPAKM